MNAPVIEPDAHYGKLVNALSVRPRDPAWLAGLRADAAEAFRLRGLPSPRDESWRYTTLEFLRRHPFVPPGAQPQAGLRRETVDAICGVPAGMRLVFVNGRFEAGLSAIDAAAGGVSVEPLDDALLTDPGPVREHLARIADTRGDAFAAMNASLMEDGAVVRFHAGAGAETPVELVHVSLGGDEPRLVHPHHLVMVEAGAQATLIERYVAVAEGLYFNNAVTEVVLGEGSRLRHERLQEESPNAYHLSAVHVRQARSSSYSLVTASLGAIWARTGVTVTFAGEEASAELDGLSVAGDRQLCDVHLDVRHEVPHCTSRETFRGILDGRGRAVFDGRIRVARDAQKTDASLSNDNLMLSRNAEVDTKPQLEIYADDVRCSHGTTVGELDDNMIFYLRSRGIDAKAARQMLCLGFAGETLAAFSSASLRERAQMLLQQRLATSSGSPD